MKRPTVDADAVMHANAALQAARCDGDMDPTKLHALLKETIAGYVDNPTQSGIRRLCQAVHNSFREVESVVCITTPSLIALIEAVEALESYIKWLEGGGVNEAHSDG